MTRPSRRLLTRRMLLGELGVAGLGVAVLAACGGDDDGDAADRGTSGTEPDLGGDAAGTTSSEAAAGTDGEPGADPTLRWEHVSFGFVSAFVLVRGREAAVVDTGQGGGAQDLLDALGLLGASWSDVRHVVLTHRHGDHVGGLDGVLGEATAATVYAGEGDLAAIESPRPITAVGDGDEVLGLGVIETPGHTPGSISLFDTGTGLLVAGDAVNGDGEGGLLGPNPDFTPDMETGLRSVGTLAALMPTVAAFGHGGPPVDTDVADQLAAIAVG